MLENFEKGVIPLLHLMMKLLEKIDKELFETIEMASP